MNTDKTERLFFGFLAGMVFAVLSITVSGFLYTRGYADGKKAAISAAKGE